MKYFVLLALVAAGCLGYLISSGDLGAPSFPSFKSFGSASDSALDSISGTDSSGVDLGAGWGEESGSLSDLVLMKFGAPWCPPCRAIDKELYALGQANLPLEIRKINVDERPDMANQFNVSSIPRIILLQDGRKVGDLTGYHSANELAVWIKESASSKALAAEKSASDPAEVHSNPYFK